ncbi:MAG: hypothetical protein IKV55_01000 [Oscillospiraceae bacterium]|nr:hypothetical protein [Oscillospiraceae bacterium]
MSESAHFCAGAPPHFTHFFVFPYGSIMCRQTAQRKANEPPFFFGQAAQRNPAALSQFARNAAQQLKVLEKVSRGCYYIISY